MFQQGGFKVSVRRFLSFRGEVVKFQQGGFKVSAGGSLNPLMMVPVMVMVGHLGPLSLDGFGPWRVDVAWWLMALGESSRVWTMAS